MSPETPETSEVSMQVPSAAEAKAIASTNTQIKAKAAQKSMRDKLRNELLSKKHKPERIAITLFGMQIDLLQPTLEAVLKVRDSGDISDRSVSMIIQYAVVPGTDDRIFVDDDVAVIRSWPWTTEMTKLQEALLKLTGINIDDAMEDLRKDPLAESSSKSAET